MCKGVRVGAKDGLRKKEEFHPWTDLLGGPEDRLENRVKDYGCLIFHLGWEVAEGAMVREDEYTVKEVHVPAQGSRNGEWE